MTTTECLIKYMGENSSRSLTSEDLRRHDGVEGFEDTTFIRGESVSVSRAIAKALLSKPLVYGAFISDEGTPLDNGGESSEGSDEPTPKVKPRNKSMNGKG